MNIIQLIIQFVVSWSVVVWVTLISKYIDSKWAWLLVALPIMTILGFVFISMNSKEEITQRYLLSALLFMIPAALYIGSLYLLFWKINFFLNCLIAFILLIIGILIIQKFI